MEAPFANLDQAAADPHRFATRLVGSPFSRLRLGDRRVILKIEVAAVRAIAVEVEHGRSAYR